MEWTDRCVKDAWKNLMGNSLTQNVVLKRTPYRWNFVIIAEE
jgi:hypothetical protein